MTHASLQVKSSGKSVHSPHPHTFQIVDQVADPAALLHAAKQAALGLADGSLRPDRAPKGLVQRLTKHVIENTEFGRNFACKKAREMVMKQTKGVYPAPLKIIDVLQESAKHGFGSREGYEAEVKAFGELGMTPESRSLVTIYFGQTACKKNPYKPSREDKTIGVLGAGLMGAGIAAVTVPKGKNILLKDARPEGLAKGMAGIYKGLDSKVKRRSLSEFERDRTYSNVLGLTDQDAGWERHFKRADMIIEAVFEDIELKHKIIKQFESITPDHCIFASNTSAIPIAKLAEASKRPDKFIGMHYFSPVEKMPLLEIIRTKDTSDDTVARAFAMGLQQGKTPIVVKDVAGFYVNRALGPYSDEGLALLLDGAGIKAVDSALTSFGFPVGPMTLVDEVGIDVAASVGKNLAGDLGIRVGTADPALIERCISQGWLGRKTGKGMHIFPAGKGKKTVNPEIEALLAQVREERGKPSSGVRWGGGWGWGWGGGVGIRKIERAQISALGAVQCHRRRQFGRRADSSVLPFPSPFCRS